VSQEAPGDQFVKQSAAVAAVERVRVSQPSAHLDHSARAGVILFCKGFPPFPFPLALLCGRAVIAQISLQVLFLCPSSAKAP